MTQSLPKVKTILAPELKVTVTESGNGRLEGYANVFNVKDSYNDVTLPGAFSKHLQEFIGKGFLLIDHEWEYDKAVGFIVDAYEDAKGLYFVAEFHGDDKAQGIRQKVAERMAAGKEVGLSIGYWTLAESTGQFMGETVNLLEELRVREVSIVVAQSNEDSMATSVKRSRGDEHQSLIDDAQNYLSRVKGINDLGRSESWQQDRANELKALGALFMQAADELTPVQEVHDESDGDALAALALLDADLVL